MKSSSKKFFATMVAVFSLLTFISSAQAAIEIKLAHVGPAINDKTEVACQLFKNYVEKESNGELKVKTYPASQLGNERELFEGAQLGTIEMMVNSSAMVTVCPEYSVLDIPYLFPSSKVAFKVLDGPFGKDLAGLLLEKTGIRLLEYGDNGYRHTTNSVRPIRSPKDFKGLKIRTMENQIHMAIIRELGAIPTPLPFGDVYTALSQGMVDGQENPVGLIEKMRFHEVQKYLTFDGHVYNPFPLFINETFFKSLSAKNQKIILDGAVKWRDEHRKYFAKQEKDSLEVVKAAGVKIVNLTPEEHKQFVEATKPVISLVEKKAGKDILNKALNAIKEAQK